MLILTFVGVGGGRGPGPGSVLAAEFLAALDDVPLMPGLKEVENSGVAFEGTTGRIVETEVMGQRGPTMDAGRVHAFYAATLPALGWRAESRGRFVRGGERLTVTVAPGGKRIVVRFALRPQ
jgi:hypothetical protein